MKKFNGHRCERRNLTDLLLGTGPTGKKRAQPKAKKRPKNYATAPMATQMSYGGKVPKMNPGGPVEYPVEGLTAAGLTGPQAAMFQYLISQGASPAVALGITSVTQKESAGKAEAVEKSYAGSTNDRIRGINSRFARVFGNMPDEELDKLKADPEAFFNLLYDDPENLGNTERGDGYKYRGRGLVQLTGRKNYQDASQALFGDDRLVENPDLLLNPDVAGQAAGWFALTRGKGVGGYLDFDLGTETLTDQQLQQVLDGTYATIASAGTLSPSQVQPQLLTKRYGQYSTGMPKMQRFVKEMPLSKIMALPDQAKIEAERKEATDFLQRVDQNNALVDSMDALNQTQGFLGNIAVPDATMYNMAPQIRQMNTREYGGPINPDDPQFKEWLAATSRQYYPEYTGGAIGSQDFYKMVSGHTDKEKYPANMAINPTLLPQNMSQRYMSQQFGSASPGAKRMTMSDAYQAAESRYNTNRETEALYNAWLSKQRPAPTQAGPNVNVAEDGRSFTVTGTASQMNLGGSTMFDPSLLAELAAQNPQIAELLQNNPEMKDKVATMAPGQVADFVGKHLLGQGKASLGSSIGQSIGSFIKQNSKTVNDPTAKYGFGEGLGSAISGATNPLAMSFGPAGMAVGALLGLGKDIFMHDQEKNEYLKMRAEERENLADQYGQASEQMSKQVLSAYDQQGTGGAYYRYGGTILDKYFTGGPTGDGNPPAVMPGMEAYAQYANINPELAAAVANAPVRNDRLTSYSAGQEGINEYNAAKRQEAERFEPVRQALTNPTVMMDAAQLGLGAVQASELPVASQVAGALNTVGYGARAVGSYLQDDPLAASMYGGLSALSGLGMIPGVGVGADAAVIAKQLEAMNATRAGAPMAVTLANEAGTVGRGARALKAAHTAEHVAHPAAVIDKTVNVGTGGQFKPSYAIMGHKYGGPVDYETEKSEVILASPNDPPVAVGQGKYTKVSGNLYKAKGPSHENGGIPTRGATQPFVDNMGYTQNSPYVFSDSKDLAFDASEILSMIR